MRGIDHQIESKTARASSSNASSAASKRRLELFGPAGSDDGRGDSRLLQHPGHAGRRQVPAAPLAVGFQRLNRLELDGVPVPIAVKLARRPERKATARLGPWLGLDACQSEGRRPAGCRRSRPRPGRGTSGNNSFSISRYRTLYRGWTQSYRAHPCRSLIAKARASCQAG